MSTSKIKSIRHLLFLALIATGLFLATGAGEDRELFDEKIAARKLDEVRVRDLVQKAMPDWQAGVLEVKDGKDWAARLDFNQVFKAMEDEPVKVDKLPPRASRLGDKDKVARLDPDRGKVRYVNRARAWSYNQASTRAADKQAAIDLVAKAVTTLGLPRDEISKLRVDTQVAGLLSPQSKTIEKKYEMYRVVTLVRAVNKLPVYGTRARAAVANHGVIQRLLIDWPPFRTPPGLSLRLKDEVVGEVTKAIMERNPLADTTVQAYLAYAPIFRSREVRGEPDIEAQPGLTGRDADDELPDTTQSPPARSPGKRTERGPVFYVPSVVVSVYSSPTPYLLVVPVASKQR